MVYLVVIYQIILWRQRHINLLCFIILRSILVHLPLCGWWSRGRLTWTDLTSVLPVLCIARWYRFKCLIRTTLEFSYTHLKAVYLPIWWHSIPSSIEPRLLAENNSSNVSNNSFFYDLNSVLCYCINIYLLEKRLQKHTCQSIVRII